MDSIDIRLGKFLHRESPWPIPKADQDWSDLSEREQVALINFAGRIVDETLRSLIEFAESPPLAFKDVALHASYWLIEFQALRNNEAPG